MIAMAYSVKGGAGRSTAIANIAVELAQRGSSVLCIDLDFEGGGIRYVMGVKDDNAMTIQDVLNSGRLDISEKNMYPAHADYGLPGRLYLLPSDKIIDVVHDNDDINIRLERFIESMKLKFDFILLDAPSGWGAVSSSSLVLSNTVLLFVRYSRQHIFGTINFFYEKDLIGSNLDTTFLSISSAVPPGPNPLKERYTKYYNKFSQIVQEIPEDNVLKWDEQIVVLDTPLTPAGKGFKNVANMLVRMNG